MVKFLGLNAIIVGGILLGVLIYLLILVNKRRQEKFLHTKTDQEES
jgi:hypothetical protein